MRVSVIAVALVMLSIAGVALAQSAPSVTPQPPGNVVPAWVFYWVLGLSSAVGAALLTVIKILWERGNKVSGLSEDERNKLNQLYDWHNRVDDDQIPLWYTPRSWVELIKSLQQDHSSVKHLLNRLVEQHDGINADLRNQLRERLEMHDRLHVKMLKLAVRVQQAVEALAGLEPPSIENDLDDLDYDTP